MSNPIIVAELKRIAAAHNGILNVEDVVEEARPADSPIHSRFNWDDSKAAHEYRLMQARALIRVCVEFTGPTDAARLEHVFVSLTPDRLAGGGYRTIVSVMSDEQQRAQLLADAVADLRRWQQKYDQLVELSEVFAAIDTIAPLAQPPARRRRGRQQPQPQPTT